MFSTFYLFVIIKLNTLNPKMKFLCIFIYSVFNGKQHNTQLCRSYCWGILEVLSLHYFFFSVQASYKCSPWPTLVLRPILHLLCFIGPYFAVYFYVKCPHFDNHLKRISDLLKVCSCLGPYRQEPHQPSLSKQRIFIHPSTKALHHKKLFKQNIKKSALSFSCHLLLHV